MKKDIKAFLRRVKTMSFARMEANVKAISRETGVSKARIRADMICCAMRSGVGYLDYRVFGFATNRDKANRKTYMTMNHNARLSRAVNDRNAIDVFVDKSKFNKAFRAYIGRDFLILPESTPQQLADFCRGKASVFAKVTSSFGGQGVEKLTLSDSTDYPQLYQRLLSEGKNLVEDTLVQHPEMERLCPNSVNTLRMVTVLKDGVAHLVYALVRMGNGKSHTDNISSGGMYALLDQAGRISEKAFCDKTSGYYTSHPVSGVVFHDFVVPYFQEAKALFIQAAQVEPRVGYVGWDVAITPAGPVLVEGNHLPGYDMCQNSGLNNSKTGALPWFEKILGKDFFA